MSRAVFKSNEQGQVVLFPSSLDEKVPQDSPARLVNQIVDNLDIAEIIDTYKGGGTSAYHPRMMLKVVLYSYLNNIYSSRKIEQALPTGLVSCGFRVVNSRITTPSTVFVPAI